ncbi:MAG: hypothetical protein AB9873_02195 [Syntrophobacteraceae bacterium]
MGRWWIFGALAAVLTVLAEDSLSFAKPRDVLIPVQRERCEAKFRSLDVNKDDRVSLDEFRAIVDKPDPRVDPTFKARDVNGDDLLTQGEFCARRGGLRTLKPGAQPPVSAR